MAARSPFASTKKTERIRAAHQMIAQREREMAHLSALLDKATDAKKRRVLTQRLLATKHNLDSWRDYVGADYYREPRAVIVPAA